jgi:hypothetical protein
VKEWLDDFLNNEKLINDIKSGLVLIVAVGLPLLYFAYSENFKLDILLTIQFGILALFVVFGNVITWLEISDKAIRDEKLVNEELQKEEKLTIEKQQTLPRNIDDLIDFNVYYNETKQKNRNRKYTESKIERLRSKITNAKVKGKPYHKYQQKIDNLKKNPLYDKSYKPVKIQNIISIEKRKENEIEGNDSLHVNIKTYGWKSFAIKQVVKSLGIGGSGLFLLGFSDTWETIVAFYLIYIIELLMIVLFRYPSIRKLTNGFYILTLKNKRNYIDEYHKWKKEADNEQNESTTLCETREDKNDQDMDSSDVD